MMRRIASSFGDDHVGALDFVFASHAGLNEDFVPFDSQVVVLNLEALRRERVAERVIGLMTDRGVSYADALPLIVGGHYSEIDGEWNVRAQWEAEDRPKLVNWQRQGRYFGQMALSR